MTTSDTLPAAGRVQEAPPAAPGPAFHVVQVGYDDSVFRPGQRTDFPDRQAAYGRVLAGLVPGGHLTNLVLTTLPDARETSAGGVRFLPVPFRRRQLIPFAVRDALARLHAERPIAIATTQTVLEDGLGALLFRRGARVPVVGQIHFDLFSPAAQRENFGRFPWSVLLKAAAFRALRRFDGLRVVGEGIRDRLAAGKYHANVHLCPVAMPILDATAPAPAEGSRKVIFVGRLVRQKRLDRWLEAAAAIAAGDPLATFEIAGEGELRPALEAQARALGLAERVRFRGNLAYADLPAFYASAGAFLLTSAYEGFGRVVVEAMHFGVPVVATRITGVEDIVESGRSGFLHPPGDTAGLAGSVLKLLAEPDLRRRVGEAGRARVDERYAPARLSREWMGILVSAGRTTRSESPVFVKARRPTWKRWKQLSTMRLSLLRALQYEAIRGVRLEGRTLDVGGGARNSYYGLLEFAGAVENINIDPGISPTYLLDLNKPLPLPSDAYDNILSLNTWEHIYQDELAVREAIRVLKPGGRFLFSIPYLYKVHGSPSDYHRHTAFWWRDFLQSLGVSEADLRIEPLVWDPFSSALSLCNFDNKGWLRRLAMLRPLLSPRHGRGERVPHGWFDEFALGYYITGTK